MLVTEIFEQNQDEQLGLCVDLFENLQEYGLRCVDFTIEMAAWINLIFRLTDFLIVSLHFVHTSW